MSCLPDRTDPADPADHAQQAGRVTLREITADSVLSVLKLQVQDAQKGLVASNAVSLAQALFAPEAWYRAVYLDNTVAGFVMLQDESLRALPPPKPGLSVWRLMVDARFQGQGVGRSALQLVIAQVRARQVFDVLTLSFVPGPGSPEPFYRLLGFVPTGRLLGQEVELALPLWPDPPPGPVAGQPIDST